MKDTDKIVQDKGEMMQNLWNSWKEVQLREVWVYFNIFQPKDMLNLGLDFNKCQSACAYTSYAYKKSIIHTLGNYIVSTNKEEKISLFPYKNKDKITTKSMRKNGNMRKTQCFLKTSLD